MKKIILITLLLAGSAYAYAQSLPNGLRDDGTVTFINKTPYKLDIYNIHTPDNDSCLKYYDGSTCIGSFRTEQPNGGWHKADFYWKGTSNSGIPDHVLEDNSISPISMNVTIHPSDGSSAKTCTIKLDEHDHEHGFVHQRNDYVPSLVDNNCQGILHIDTATINGLHNLIITFNKAS